MSWSIHEKVVRHVGTFAHVDVIIQRQNDESPFIYAVVDEKRDKALVMHAKTDSLEQAKIMALGSLHTYEAMINQQSAHALFVVEDGIIMARIRTEYGDKLEPLATSGDLSSQIHEVILSVTEVFLNVNKEVNDGAEK